MHKFNIDKHFGDVWEKELESLFNDMWLEVTPTSETDILDFKLINKNWDRVFVELKTRRCEKGTYPDTMIWINKLVEAYDRYNRDWAKTFFVFKYNDWIYFIDPFEHLPARFDYRKWRYDRWEFDKPKWWCYYHTSQLIPIK